MQIPANSHADPALPRLQFGATPQPTTHSHPTHSKVILEFKDTKGALPPPLNVVEVFLYELPKRAWRKFKRRNQVGSMIDTEERLRGFKSVIGSLLRELGVGWRTMMGWDGR